MKYHLLIFLGISVQISSCYSGGVISLLSKKSEISQSRKVVRSSSQLQERDSPMERPVLRPLVSLSPQEASMVSLGFKDRVIGRFSTQKLRCFFPVCVFIKDLELEKIDSRLLVKAAAQVDPQSYGLFLGACRNEIEGVEDKIEKRDIVLALARRY